MNDSDLAIDIARAVDGLRNQITEPVWAPLEAILPYDWCGGFMFMEGREARVMQDNYAKRPIWSYKHGITRQYLHIGDDLGTYTYRADMCEIGDPLYMRVNTNFSIERIEMMLAEMGETMTTKFDHDFKAERNRRLIAAGYAVIL